MSALDMVTAQLRAVTGYEGRNGSWRCPAHEDRNPSLSVNQGDNGVVLHCHAGCDWRSVLEALDLHETDLFDEPAVGWDANRPEIVGSYPYTDENGEVLFEVVRYRPKGFRQRRPDGRGGWVWNLQGTRRVLYRLPDVVAAVRDGSGIVWVCEGEKDADAVARVLPPGEVATTCPQGAGKWRQEYTDVLADHPVVIVADRDEPGYRHAAHVAAELRAAGCHVELLQPRKGKDVAEHLALGLTLDDLDPLDLSAIGRNGSDGSKGSDFVPIPPISPNGDDRAPWPVLDHAALYGPAGAAVALLAPHTEADPAAVLVTLLAGWGAIVGAGPHARGGHVAHPARLSPVIVGETAKARKGTSWSAARLLLDRVDLTFMASRVLGGFGSGEAVIDEVRDPQPSDDDKPDDPGAEDKRLLIHEPEFAKVLKVCTREASILSTVIRDAWDGSRLQRRARASTSVATGHHIAIVGHITAPELRRNLTETEIAGGFANWLLWVCARRSQRLPFDSSPDLAALDQLGRLLRDRAEAARKVGTVPFTPDGRDVWSDLYDEMADDDPGGMLGAVVARPEPQTLRLALTFALLDGARAIGPEHIRAGWAVWGYSRASALYLWGDAVGDETADRLLRAIRRAGPDGLDRTEIRAVIGSNNVPARRIDAALAELEQRRLIETVTVAPEGGKGRPRAVSRATTSTPHTRRTQP